MIPERFRLRAGQAGDKHVEMRMPAGADAKHHSAVGQAAMHDGEQHPLAPWLEFKQNTAAALSPSEGEPAGRVELGDPALHPMLVVEALRPLSRRGGQLVVAPPE